MIIMKEKYNVAIIIYESDFLTKLTNNNLHHGV